MPKNKKCLAVPALFVGVGVDVGIRMGVRVGGDVFLLSNARVPAKVCVGIDRDTHLGGLSVAATHAK